MDEFPRVHDFTEKTGRREEWTISICMPWRNLQVHSERKFHPSIRSFEQNFFFLGGLVSSSSARYSNFVYDNTIREIIIFVTIVTEKKKIYMARSLYCRIIGLSFADKNCLYNLGKYHLRKGRNERKTFRGKSSQRYRLVVFFLSRTLTFPWPFHVRIQLSGFRLFLE